MTRHKPVSRHEAAVRLQQAADAILDAIPATERQRMGAVNWGDLRCREVEVRQSLLRDAGPEIWLTVEEASPHASELHLYLLGKLCEQGWPFIGIETDW